ncbi:MAG: hypothetical protein IPL40_13880 [Proteobacteria bacterium]|nr:hypothetical protein [Pseudomonadota bacterium]
MPFGLLSGPLLGTLLSLLAAPAWAADDRDPSAARVAGQFAAHDAPIVALDDALNAHVHLGGVLSGSELIALARREGGLAAGIEALALGGGSFEAQVRTASRLLTASAHYDHFALYGLRGRFIRAAFPGARYGIWLAAALHELRLQARRTLVAEGADDAERAILTARQRGLSLDGIGFLLSERRPRSRDAKASARVLRRFPDEVLGLNLHGPEAGAEVGALHAGLDQLLRHRPRGYFLLHAGELDTRNGGRHSVNSYLAALAQRAGSDRLVGKTGGVRPIVAHAAHIADPAQARADLERAARQGLVITLNPQPLANLAYATVERAEQIAVVGLGWPHVAFGTDNVGSFALNRWSTRLLLAGRPEVVTRRVAAAVARIHAGWPSLQAFMERVDANGDRRRSPECPGLGAALRRGAPSRSDSTPSTH